MESNEAPSALSIRVRRLTADGQLRIVYDGRLLQASPEGIILEAYWERSPLDLGYIVLSRQIGLWNTSFENAGL